MRALADWRSQKALCAQTKAALNRPIPRRSIPDGYSDDKIDEWVTKMLDEVTATLVQQLSTQPT